MDKVSFEEIQTSTSKRVELIDITHDVEKIVTKNNVTNGFCLVYAPHATAAIIANERESGLMQDIINKIEKDYPKRGDWLHDRIDNNTSAHLASAFIGSSRIFPVKDGKLVRGTWQNIFLFELDGPRHRRRVIVEVIGV